MARIIAVLTEKNEFLMLDSNIIVNDCIQMEKNYRNKLY